MRKLPKILLLAAAVLLLVPGLTFATEYEWIPGPWSPEPPLTIQNPSGEGVDADGNTVTYAPSDAARLDVVISQVGIDSIGGIDYYLLRYEYTLTNLGFNPQILSAGSPEPISAIALPFGAYLRSAGWVGGDTVGDIVTTGTSVDADLFPDGTVMDIWDDADTIYTDIDPTDDVGSALFFDFESLTDPDPDNMFVTGPGLEVGQSVSFYLDALNFPGPGAVALKDGVARIEDFQDGILSFSVSTPQEEFIVAADAPEPGVLLLLGSGLLSLAALSRRRRS